MIGTKGIDGNEDNRGLRARRCRDRQNQREAMHEFHAEKTFHARAVTREAKIYQTIQSRCRIVAGG